MGILIAFVHPLVELLLQDAERSNKTHLDDLLILKEHGH
jgi:hypothetical protein